jgi:ribosomal protein S18 acetylase RimI-like enzyme
MKLRRLNSSDAAAYRSLRLRGLRECPAAFGSSYAEEARKPLERYAERLATTPDHWTYGAFDGEDLVGVVTLVRDGHLKSRHKADLYAMYVAPRHRRLGLGRQLLERGIARARAMRGVRRLKIAVVESNQPALSLYRSLGFRVFAREEEALRTRAGYHAELFMVLLLGGGRQPRRRVQGS